MQRMGRVVVAHTFRQENHLVDVLTKQESKGSYAREPLFLLTPPGYTQKLFWLDYVEQLYEHNTYNCNVYVSRPPSGQTTAPPL